VSLLGAPDASITAVIKPTADDNNVGEDKLNTW